MKFTNRPDSSRELPLCMPEGLDEEFRAKVEEYRMRMEIVLREDVTVSGPLASMISGEFDMRGRHEKANYYRDALYKYTIGKLILDDREGIIDIAEARERIQGLNGIEFDEPTFRNATGVFRSYFAGKKRIENRLGGRYSVYSRQPEA